MDDLADLGRAIVDGSGYLVLGTADASGTPWTSPLFFAHEGYRTFLWVSRPGARHSVNLADRSEVSFVVFNSAVPIGQGIGVYCAATAAVVPQRSVAASLRVFSARAEAFGGSPWSEDAVAPWSSFRLYRATVTEQFVLDEHDQRIPTDLGA